MSDTRQYYWDIRYSPEMEAHMLTICPKDFFDKRHHLSDMYADNQPAIDIINAALPFGLVEDMESVYSLLPEWVAPLTQFLTNNPQFVKGAAFTLFMDAGTSGEG